MKLLEFAGEPPRPTLYDDDPTPLSFVIGRNAGLSLDAKQRLLAMDREQERLSYLADHLGRLLRRIRRARRVRDLAQGDGQASGFPEPDTE